MQEHVKLEVAIELSNQKLARLTMVKDQMSAAEYKRQFKILINEREKISQGERTSIEKILQENRKK